MQPASQIESSIWAGIVGDALGVPVEHSTRGELSLCAVKNLLGYGRYDQPEGTWSDDTSMVLCTMESLSKGYDLKDLAQTFCNWLFESRWTATGHIFDSGLTTFMALERFRTGQCEASHCGGVTSDDNGNGSLMRVLPAAIYFRNRPLEDFLGTIHEISGVTHGHPRAKVGCGIYALIVRHLLAGEEKKEACSAALGEGRTFYDAHEEFRAEIEAYDRVLSGVVPELHMDEISSSGYVVDTLEASVWCFLRNHTTKDILLAAVNLGLDTDTTGMVAGGLAGLAHGLSDVPADWLDSLARRDDIGKLLQEFVTVALKQ